MKTENMNGTSTNVFNFLISTYADELTKYVYAMKIRGWFLQNTSRKMLRHREDMPHPEEMLGWATSYHGRKEIRYAWDALQNAIAMHKAKRHFKNSQEQYISNKMVSKLEN